MLLVIESEQSGGLRLGEGLHEAGVEGGGFDEVLDFGLLVGGVGKALAPGAVTDGGDRVEILANLC